MAYDDIPETNSFFTDWLNITSICKEYGAPNLLHGASGYEAGQLADHLGYIPRDQFNGWIESAKRAAPTMSVPTEKLEPALMRCREGYYRLMRAKGIEAAPDSVPPLP